MKKVLIVIAAAILITAFAAGNAFAWSDLMQGEPKIIPGKDYGVYFWVDGKGSFHVRVTGPGTHTFWGILETENPLSVTNKVAIDGGDKFQSHKPNVTEFTIKTTNNAVKGFDFDTKGSYMAFEMKLDGKKVMKQKFFAGKDKVEFEHTPFKVFDIKPGQKGLPPQIRFGPGTKGKNNPATTNAPPKKDWWLYFK
ncbi:MAG: hypothetical protein LWY06_18310 [Firmicutes bacterium]|nr:hypothetical protein [Bacillota bacterium]